MRAVITVIGKDTVGILAKVSGICAKYNANIIEVTQSVLQDLFCMIMLADISKINVEYKELSAALEQNAERAAELIDQWIQEKHYRNQDNYTAVILQCCADAAE